MNIKEKMIEQIIAHYKMKPLTGEGGLYLQAYRSEEYCKIESLPHRYRSQTEPKPFGTAIIYLLTPSSLSRMHRLSTDEIFHFYLGDPVEMLWLLPDGTGKTVTLGQDILHGQQIQTVVPKGTWQGSHLVPGGSFALLGTTMAPGYTKSDYEDGDRQFLLKEYPRWSELIGMLTEVASYR